MNKVLTALASDSWLEFPDGVSQKYDPGAMFLIYESIQAIQEHHIEIYLLLSYLFHQAQQHIRELSCVQGEGGWGVSCTSVPRWQDSGMAPCRQAGSRVRIGLYFWKGVCVWIGRLVRSAEIFPTAATVRR